ncbi:MAG: FUSC family protein [Aeromicrobium sp.]|uniref:FUSC family protein n=1 Tax=Aeromicrobium sp. TaxID=1871063 RepID=UPI003C4D9D41
MSTGRDVPLRRLRLPRSTDSLTDRLWVLRRRWRTLLRLSVGTGGSFFLATTVLNHEQAFFAPIAAIIVLIAGAGLRGRTLFELVLGVAIGVLMGELLVLGIGRGAWQMALIVVFTVVVSTLLGLKGLALTQAATSSVLLAAIVPAVGAGNPAITRFLDALVGGVVGLAAILLIPRNPVRDIDREVQSILTRVADILGRIAQALRTVDADLADQQLAAARDMQPQVDVMTATAANVREIARMSPVRWSQREHVQTYVATVRDLDNAVRDTRVLARKASTLLRFREPVPADMESAIDGLARAFTIFADDLSERDDFEEARTVLVESAKLATNALTETMTINSATIAAQVRSLAADLLYASGYTRDEVDRRLDFT